MNVVSLVRLHVDNVRIINSINKSANQSYSLLFLFTINNQFLPTGTHCKADFYSQINEGGDYSPENLVLDDAADDGAGGERRRSERGRKREKPDYYDSLEFENKVETLKKLPMYLIIISKIMHQNQIFISSIFCSVKLKDKLVAQKAHQIKAHWDLENGKCDKVC